MTFLWPQFLWLLWLLPLLAWFYLWLSRRRSKLALRHSSLVVIRRAAAAPHWRRHVPPGLFLLGIGLALLAGSRPLATITLPSNTATIMLVMDVSLSMRVTDVKPTRLEAAQEAAKTFLKELPRNVKVGIVTFASTAQTVQPATLNREALVEAIDRFQMQWGTAVGSGLVVALSELFPDEGIDIGQLTYGNSSRGISIDEHPRKPKKDAMPVPPGSYGAAAIILLTDGRRTTGIDTLEAARMAANHGVRVYTVGLGTVDGTITHGSEGWSMYIKLDEPMLKAVAKNTQAEYFYAGTAEGLKKVYQKLNAQLRVEKKETEISGLLVLAAVVLEMVSAVLSALWFNRLL